MNHGISALVQRVEQVEGNLAGIEGSVRLIAPALGAALVQAGEALKRPR